MSARGWLNKVLGRRPRIARPSEFMDFTAAQAAFIAQRTLLAYCEVKVGIHYKRLSAEPVFQQAYEIARWETFAAVLADVIVIAEGQLRPFAAARLDRLAEELGGIYAAILQKEERPAHRPAGWQDAIEVLRPRLSRAQLAAPLAPDVVAQHSAARLVEVLPIHASLRPGERDSVMGGIKFRVLAFAEELPRRADIAAVANALVTPAA